MSSSNPLAPADPAPENGSISAAAASAYPDGAIVTVTGAANGITHKTTKQDNPWATFQLTAGDAVIQVSVFPLHYPRYEALLAAARPLRLSVTGRLDRREAVPALIATTIEEAPGTASRP